MRPPTPAGGGTPGSARLIPEVPRAPAGSDNGPTEAVLRRSDNAKHLRDVQRRFASLEARRARAAEAQRLSAEALQRSLDRVVRDAREAGLPASTSQHGGHNGTQPNGAQLVEALVQLALLRVDGDHAVCLDRIAGACALVFGAAAQVSVAVGPPERPTRSTAQTKDAQAVDGSQIQAGEGPARDAWAGQNVVVSADLSADQRWPVLAGLMKHVPLTSAIAVPVLAADARLAVVSAYSRSTSAFGELDADDLASLASGVAAVLRRDSEYDHLLEQTHQLETALTSRAVIDQAKGIVMAYGACDADQAFQRLVQTSRHNNVKLREVARLIVQRTQTGPGLPGRPRQ